jgi:hypothetical protein
MGIVEGGGFIRSGMYCQTSTATSLPPIPEVCDGD